MNIPIKPRLASPVEAIYPGPRRLRAKLQSAPAAPSYRDPIALAAAIEVLG